MEWNLNQYLDQDEKPVAEKRDGSGAAPQQRRAPARRTAPQSSGRANGGAARAKRRVGSLPPWVLVLVSMLFYTFLFHVFSEAIFEDGFSFGRFLTLVLFSVSFALITALVGTIGKRRKVQKICALVIVILWAILFLMEYFILDSFKNFYTLEGIFTGAGNAGEADFAARTFGLVFSNLWRLLLFALPILGWYLANRYLRLPRILTRGVRRYLAVGGIGLFLVALFFGAVISPDKQKMGKSYDFTGAVRGFGLPMGYALDMFRGGGESEFEIEDNTGFTLPPKNTDENPVQSSDTPVQTDANGSTVPQTTETAAPPEPTYHMLNLDFDGIIDSSSSDTAVQVSKYLRTLTPSTTNEMTGMFKGKNLILITAEAFSAELIDPELTPTLYRMATKGIHFTDYYQPAWGGSTSSGEFSVMTGVEPARGVKSITNTIGRNMDVTIGNQLKKLGYFTRAYHNNSYTYYDRDKTHQNMGYEKFIGMGNGMEEGVTKVWPASDLEMIDFTVPQYVNQQPFSVYYMTVSGHGLYSWGGNAQSARHQEDVKNLPYSETVKAYYACNMEVELAMKSLINQLEAAGIADDTLVVLTADHYPYCLEKSDTWKNDQDYLSEYYGVQVENVFQRDHNALIMWSGCLEDKNLEINTPTYSLDIVPTLLNLFGVEYDSRLYVGRDVFSDQEPLVFWPDHSWKTDKGSWNASKSSGSEFTPAEGVEVDQDYLDRIRKSVSNKLNYSYSVLGMDYFALLFKD